MSVELNHTIIPAKDKWASAKFLADILNLEAGPEWGHFVPVKTDNGVTLDFSDAEGFRPQHYAFLVSDAEFDAALARIRAAGVKHYANFRRERPGEINHLYGGRGVYFDDPNGHVLELITRPYGPTPEGGRAESPYASSNSGSRNAFLSKVTVAEQPAAAPNAPIRASEKEPLPSLRAIIAAKTSCSLSTTRTSACNVRSMAATRSSSERP